MTNKRISHTAGFILAALVWLGCVCPSAAAVYKCLDSSNRTVYQDKPCQQMATARLPVGLAGSSGQEEERAFFWKAAGDKGSLYLLGSLHFGAQSPFLMPQMVIDAFDASDTLVVEADIGKSSEKNLAAALGEKGRYVDQADLESHVKQTTWNKTVEMGKKLGIGEEFLRQFKPWRVALILASESLKKAGYSPDYGIDQSFIKKAEGKKPVLALENVEAQLELFEDLTGQEQEQMLIQTLQDLSRAPELYQSIVDAWKQGDAEAMDLITRQSFDSGQLSSKLLKVFILDRNEGMANRLKEMAGDGKTYFVVVGAAHMGGDKGILKLLQERGFRVTQP